MPFKVRLFPGAPDYETLHVAKLTDFPLEPRDYKPYSQARVCFAGGGLHVQLLSFEAEPLPDSRMLAVFRLTPEAAPLELCIRADGGFAARMDGKPLENGAALFHAFTGEDLQGIYWGGNVTAPGETLARYFGGLRLEKDVVFTGNLYKLCENPARPHYGSFYPADFAKPLTAPENLGEFLLIDY